MIVLKVHVSNLLSLISFAAAITETEGVTNSDFTGMGMAVEDDD